MCKNIFFKSCGFCKIQQVVWGQGQEKGVLGSVA